MSPTLQTVLLLGVASLLPSSSRADWIIDWSNVAKKSDGAQISSEPSTMYVSDSRVRVEQSNIVTVTDYRKERVALLDPTRQLFWSGSVDEYLTEMARERDQKLRERMGSEGSRSAPTPATESLPTIEIQKRDESRTIAGHPASKYEILSAGELFQQVWMAPDLDLSEDLDPKLYLQIETKRSSAMRGKSAATYRALYRSEAYRDLVKGGYALEVLTRHIAGSFTRSVTAIRSAEVPKDKFEIPAAYRRVRLVDVFPPAG